MRVVEIPDDLAEIVSASGVDLGAFVIQAIEEKLLVKPPIRDRSCRGKIKEDWVPPTVRGLIREDRIPWSEIEVPCG